MNMTKIEIDSIDIHLKNIPIEFVRKIPSELRYQLIQRLKEIEFSRTSRSPSRFDVIEAGAIQIGTSENLSQLSDIIASRVAESMNSAMTSSKEEGK